MVLLSYLSKIMDQCNLRCPLIIYEKRLCRLKEIKIKQSDKKWSKNLIHKKDRIESYSMNREFVDSHIAISFL